MELNYLYDIAERENIHIVNSRLKDTTGLYCEENNIKAIALDYAQLNNSVEEKCTLAEEVAHYFCDATYPLSCTDKILIDKAEYRAKKWSIKALISPSDIEKVKLLGLKYKWEIAEELGVTEDVVEYAVNYYERVS